MCPTSQTRQKTFFITTHLLICSFAHFLISGIFGIFGIIGIIWYNYCVMVWLKNTAINCHKGYYATSYRYYGNYSNVLNKC